MLCGEDEGRRYPSALKGFSERGELYGFGTSADDDNYAVVQPSP